MRYSIFPNCLKKSIERTKLYIVQLLFLAEVISWDLIFLGQTEEREETATRSVTGKSNKWQAEKGSDSGKFIFPVYYCMAYLARREKKEKKKKRSKSRLLIGYPSCLLTLESPALFPQIRRYLLQYFGHLWNLVASKLVQLRYHWTL